MPPLTVPATRDRELPLGRAAVEGEVATLNPIAEAVRLLRREAEVYGGMACQTSAGRQEVARRHADLTEAADALLARFLRPDEATIGLVEQAWQSHWAARTGARYGIFTFGSGGLPRLLSERDTHDQAAREAVRLDAIAAIRALAPDPAR